MSIFQDTGRVLNLSAAMLLIKLGTLMVLARLLLPEHFGPVALALAIQSIIASIAQLDLRDALIQSRLISRAHLLWAFRTLTVTGLGGYAGLVLGGPQLSVLFGMPDFARVLPVVALCLILAVMQAPFEALLIRRRHVRAIAMASIWGYALGFAGLGISLALVAPSAIALAWAYVSLEALKLAYMIWSYQCLPMQPDEFSSAPDGGKWTLRHDLLRFAVFGTLNRLFSDANKKIDNLIVGLLLGASALGFYSRSYALAAAPIDTVLGMSIRSILFPALAGRQDEAVRFRSSVRRTFTLVASVIMPIGITTFVLAPEIVPLIFGPGWDAAIFPLQCLALTLALRFGPRIAVAVGRALGKQKNLFFMNVTMTVIMVGAVWIGASLGGLNGASIATLATAVLHFAAASVLLVRLAQISMLELLSELSRPFLLSLLYFGILFTIVQVLRHTFDIAIISIFGSSVGALVSLVALCLLSPHVFLGKWERQKLANIALRCSKFRNAGKWVATRVFPETPN
jgi:O-antigen/teichoic acid export membrane protein